MYTNAIGSTEILPPFFWFDASRVCQEKTFFSAISTETSFLHKKIKTIVLPKFKPKPKNWIWYTEIFLFEKLKKKYYLNYLYGDVDDSW